MTKGKVTILGSNGHIGNAATIAFRDAGWVVTGLGRTNRRPVGGTRFVGGDADDVAVVKAAIADAEVVVHGLHLPYDKWGNGAAERQLQVVLDAMGNSGKTLLFPGTIYNYRAGDRTVSPGLRQSGEKPRGEIRIRLEQMLEEAAASGRIRVIILRAGDFFGPGNRGEWFEQAMLMDMDKSRVYHLGDLKLRHSWAYLPDLARAFAAVAEQREGLAPFENFHFAGYWVSHGQMMAAIQSGLGRRLKVAPLAWWMLGAVGLVNPMMRDIFRMRYLWDNEMELVDPRLDALLGAGFQTPFEDAVKATVEELAAAKLPTRKAA
ncbi:NAD-dependent epimerase/dehydratase family protein [Devosia sp. XJ19-1]|uniref:NAD-dependent epimerase/dehydratase family protein n=1 Tax=Devosia ureilytica TaxID=2952754 RepID=A0A9Q4FS70_9HYPH|nr:NAD-dependent epimerase/dehydratase family protein [Devosia ureilytica]MCP8882629.1 NAD-dependent epimerase/dehydratase family protein [Devosia ureilytica]MCP8887002.1 NAD-dependent epimerase/dehydratase family protein [Devosia ureilytica]